MKNNKTLQNHSRHYIEMAFNTDNKKRLDNPDGYGKRTGECGDTIEFFLTVTHDYIQRILFEANGCLNTCACANTVIYLTKGKAIKSAWDITPNDITNYLETLPEKETHCAELAVGAFYLALSNYQKLQRSPFEKIYGKR